MRRGVLAVVLLVAAVGAVVWIRSGSSAPRGTRQLAEGRWVVSRADRDEYFRDPTRVNAQLLLKPEPGAEPGTVARLVVAHVDPAGPAHAAGVRAGDAVLAVNGRPVSTMERALNLVHEARSAPFLEARLDRAGRIVEVRVDFE